MVTLLLDHGANPGQIMPSSPRTVWEMYLSHIYSGYIERGSLNKKEEHIEIIQVLLKHKANPSPKCVIRWSGRKRAIGKGRGVNYPEYADVLDLVSTMFSPSERRYIEMLIHEGRKNSTWFGFLGGAFG